MKKLGICFSALAVICVFLVPINDSQAKSKSVSILYESVYPKGHMRFKFTEDALDQIEQKSEGQIKFIRHYGEPVSKKEALKALGRGTIDMLQAYPTYYDGKIAIGDWQQLPGNFRKWQDCHDLCVSGEVAKIMDRAYRKSANVTYVGANPIAPYNFQVAKKSKKIRKFEDFKGLKIRSAGGSASIAVKALGASPVMTIGGEYYQAMQRGVVDAGLMTTYSLKQYRLWEVADQIVNPPLIGYAVSFIWMNQDKWKKLDPNHQNIILDVMRSKELWEKWVSVYENEQDGKIIVEAKKMGVEFYTLPSEEAEKMYRATETVWDWYIEQCEKQGLGAEAKTVKKLILERFFSQ